MSTVLVAAIIIAIAVVPAAVFIRLHKRREKKRIESPIARFNNAGVEHNLFFTHQEMLKDKILGLDATNQALLLFQFDATHTETVIDLADVETCTVYRKYDRFGTSGNKEAKADPVLAGMGLQVALSNGDAPLPIAFYDHRVNGIYEIPELEKTAKEWKGLVAQQAPRKALQRA